MMKLEYFPILLHLRHKIYSLIKLISISISLILLINITYADESNNALNLYTKQVCSVNNESNVNKECTNNIVYYPYFVYVPTYNTYSRRPSPYQWHNYYGYQRRNFYPNRRFYPYRQWQYNNYRYRRQRMNGHHR
jgi:hypothetical protein